MDGALRIIVVRCQTYRNLLEQRVTTETGYSHILVYERGQVLLYPGCPNPLGFSVVTVD